MTMSRGLLNSLLMLLAIEAYGAKTVTSTSLKNIQENNVSSELSDNCKSYKFKKVSEISVGKRYIIVGEDDGNLFVAKDLSGNIGRKYIATDSVGLESDVIYLDSDDNALEVSIGKYDDKKIYLLKNKDGKFLSEYDLNFSFQNKTNSNIKWNIYLKDNSFVINNAPGKPTQSILFDEERHRFYYKTTTSEKLPLLYEEVQDDVETVELKVGSTNYATLYYSSKNLLVPNGIEAYTYQAQSGELQISHKYSSGDIIPHGTAVVVHSSGSASYSFTVTDDEGVAPPENRLYGYDTEQTTAAEGENYYYKLCKSGQGNGIGFFWAKEEGAPFISKSHKAFLALPKETAAKGYVFETATSVSRVPATLQSTSEAIYSLQGICQPAGPLAPGIYIRGGKKVLVR